ncbi:MAG: hypothetical protein JWM95_775 [Gemmatimonadetes bacterium]|nr:hypothetical protein [Gemmatimonadota bacterium]
MLSGLLALSSLAACDIPTSAPIIDVRWLVPAQTSRISVSTLLPGGVSILADSSGFTVNAASATVTRALSADCAPCAAGNGFTGPKPAFIAIASTSTSVPPDISSASLTSGSLVINVANNYTFDPLRPNGTSAPFGNATITVSNGSTSLGSTVINGSTTALNPNGTLSITVPLAGPISGASPITIAFTVNSPAGGVVQMDASRTIVVTVIPTALKVANANVSVAGRTLSSSLNMNLDVDSAITNRVIDGKMQLTIVNPFAVTSTATVKLQPDNGAVINKIVSLGLNTTTATIPLTLAEVRSLFGHNVTITIAGAANATGPVSVSPRQTVVVTTRFDLTLEVGS